MIPRVSVIIILAAGVSLIMGYYYLTFAYFPKLAHSRGVSDSTVGLMLAFNSIPFMLVSLTSPFLMKFMGRKLWLIISLTLSSFSVFGFGWLSLINNRTWFIAITLVSRGVIGATTALFSSTSYSYAAILYSDNTQKGIGRIQAAIGIGPIVCLVASSFIYKWAGFFTTFAVNAGLQVLITVFIMLWIKNIDPKDNQDKDQEEIAETPVKRPFKSAYIFLDFRIIALIFNVMLAMALVDAPSVLVADRFEDFDLPEYLKGLTFLFSNIPFTITSLLLHRIAKRREHKLFILWSGWVLLMLGYLLIGPSGVLHLPDNVWLILVGFSFFGVAYSHLIVTSIPLIQSYAIEYDTVRLEYNKVSNYISGVFNVAFGMGSFIGPLIAPMLKNHLGYTGFTDVFALCCIISLVVFALLFFIPSAKRLNSHRRRPQNLQTKLNNSPEACSAEWDITKDRVSEPLLE